MDQIYHHDPSNNFETGDYLLPALKVALAPCPPPQRVVDLGAGMGGTTDALASWGYDVLGVEQSAKGVQIARERFPGRRYEVGDAYDDLAGRFGLFDVVVSLEVVEHLMWPHHYAGTIAKLLKPGGVAIISTPYHGYLKNLAIAALGKWDHHHTATWDGGHVKFWSRKTLGEVFGYVGLQEVAFDRAGRIPAFAKSMVVSFEKPA
jgi:SAM-dependent methyltransferase